MKKYEMDKFIFRSNVRRKMLFGVEEAAFKHEPGRSNRSYISIGMAKSMSKDNLEVLKLMNTKKFKDHQLKMRNEAFEFYKKMRDVK